MTSDASIRSYDYEDNWIIRDAEIIQSHDEWVTSELERIHRFNHWID